MPEEDLKAYIRRLLEEIWNNHDMDAVMDAADRFLAPDLVEHRSFGEAPSEGREGAKKVFRMFHTAFPDMHVEPQDMVAEGEKIVLRWTGTATHQGPFFGIPPTGRQVRVSGIDVYRVRDGKVTDQWPNMDLLGLMQQLGAVPSHGGPPPR